MVAHVETARALMLASVGPRFRAGAGGWGVYVHVPYCATRCGYCDFNTYTAAELGPGVSQESFPRQVIAEIEAAGRLLGALGGGRRAGLERRVGSVFFGGGTPTLLPADELVRILAAIREVFGLEADAEVTTEANPDSVDTEYLRTLRAGGFTRVSLGMQSAAPEVLAILDRTHTPGRAEEAVAQAHSVGFDHVSLDLIYGTPGETPAMWEDSLRRAVGTGVDHISAYALTVEEATGLGARIRRGEMPRPDSDTAAARYEVADEVLSSAGLQWYEISNWSTPGGHCRHNLGYWRGLDWWGFGPGAHSHVDGVRWWNVKHPRSYAAALGAGELPVADAEALSAAERETERIMLGLRLAEGLPLAGLPAGEVAEMVADGLVGTVVDPGGSDRVVLTGRGRLLADGVVRRLLVAVPEVT